VYSSLNLSAHHFPDEDQTPLQSMYASCWVKFPSASIVHLSWGPGTSHTPEWF